MKRSGNVGLVVMGAAAFAATFAGTAYFAWQKPSHAAGAQSQQAQQSCTPHPDGTQNCQQTARRGFAYYLLPSYFHGLSSSGSAEPRRTQGVALTGNSQSTHAVASTGTVRGGFGSTAGSSSFRMAAGG